MERNTLLNVRRVGRRVLLTGLAERTLAGAPVNIVEGGVVGQRQAAAQRRRPGLPGAREALLGTARVVLAAADDRRRLNALARAAGAVRAGRRWRPVAGRRARTSAGQSSSW
jgi:hypothetical protein